MKIIKEIFMNKRFLGVFVLLSILGIPFFGFGLAHAEPVFSITSDNEPLNEVLARIAKSTGYKIEITKGFGSKPLTVNIKKLPLEKGLREIMRMAEEINYALVVNERMKKVEIRIFGNASPGGKGGGGTHVGSNSAFHKRARAAAESDLVDVSRVAEKPEEPPEVEVMPPEIEVVNPEMDRMRHPD